MKLVIMAAIATLGFASTAMAFDEGVDADGDGVLSVGELLAVYPDMTEDVFTAIDTDEDGVISEEEMAVALESGILTS